jgi:gas vesicle protein
MRRRFRAEPFVSLRKILENWRLVMSRDSGAGSIMPFVLGVGIGAVAALLLAPKAGEDLRSDIVEGVNDGAEQISAGGKKLKRRLEKVLDQAHDRVNEAVEAGQQAYTEAKIS